MGKIISTHMVAVKIKWNNACNVSGLLSALNSRLLLQSEDVARLAQKHRGKDPDELDIN